MGRQPVVDVFVCGARAVDVKHDVRDEEAEQDRQPCDQDEPCKHPCEKDEYRMPRPEAACDAFRGAVPARFEYRNAPIVRTARENAVPFKSCAHEACLPRRTQG